MDAHPFLRYLVQFAGLACIALAFADVFMTVLYARAGTGPLSHRLATLAWAFVRRLSRATPRFKDDILGFFGPAYLTILMAAWIGLLLLGFTLLAWAGLGIGIKAQQGPTPTDFMTAFYFAGGSLTTVGSGDLRPVAPFFKFLTVIDSILGISILTLTLSYITQIYTALQRRNSLALGLHHASGGSGDAAVLLTGLGSRNDFSLAESQLAGLAAEITGVYESHHFYSVLIYFRFREPHYAMARGALLSMELVTLIQTALDHSQHGWLQRSASVTQIREAGMHLLTVFGGVYLPFGAPPVGDQNDAITDQWRARYHTAVALLRKSGISVTNDEPRGADHYVELRRRWDSFVMAFARYMEHPLYEIDPLGAHPSQTGRHREMPSQPLPTRVP